MSDSGRVPRRDGRPGSTPGASTIRLRSTTRHWLLDLEYEDPGERMEGSARALLKNCGSASLVAVAMVDDWIVGFVRVSTDGAYNVSAGTWVNPSYRRRGLAIALWALVLRRLGGEVVHVVTITAAGRAMKRRLRAEFGGRIGD